MPDSKTTPLDGLDPKRIFPNMRTLHTIRKHWLSDVEMWLAIPEGSTVHGWTRRVSKRRVSRRRKKRGGIQQPLSLLYM